MAIDIDWGFIGACEGAAITSGYVPNPDTSQSGVTIATGFDLGQRSAAAITAMGLADDLTALLTPYCGLKGRAAADYLAQNPLTVTADQAAAIDTAYRGDFVARLAGTYDDALGDAGLAHFADLGRPPQTVIASVAFQYGVNLKARAPRFWDAVTRQDWPATIAELRNFGDAFATRRNKEADLLAQAAAPDAGT